MYSSENWKPADGIHKSGNESPAIEGASLSSDRDPTALCPADLLSLIPRLTDVMPVNTEVFQNNGAKQPDALSLTPEDQRGGRNGKRHYCGVGYQMKIGQVQRRRFHSEKPFPALHMR